MPKLIATKSFKYKTRRLMAGDELEANDLEARIYTHIRKVAKPKIISNDAPVYIPDEGKAVAVKKAPAKPGARARKAKAKK